MVMIPARRSPLVLFPMFATVALLLQSLTELPFALAHCSPLVPIKLNTIKDKLPPNDNGRVKVVRAILVDIQHTKGIDPRVVSTLHERRAHFA